MNQYSNPLSDVPLKLTAGPNTVRATSNANGEATFDLSSITPGTYTATVDVDSDVYVADSTFDIGLTVNGDIEKTTVYLENLDGVPSIDMNYGDSVTFTAGVYADPYGGTPVSGLNLKLTAESNTVRATSDDNGEATFDLSSITPGTYTATVDVDSDVYEADSTLGFGLTVNGDMPDNKTTVYLEDGYHPTEPIPVGANVQITAYVSYGIVYIPDVRVKATIDKDYYDISDNMGMVSFDLSGVPGGVYDVVLVVDDDNYKSDELKYTLTIIGPTEVTINNMAPESERVITVGDDEAIQAYLVLDKETYEVPDVNVKVTIGDNIVMNKITDESGTVEFNLSTIPVGTYEIIAVVEQEGYKSNTLTIPLTVNLILRLMLIRKLFL